MASPALPPMRPGLLDPSRQAEYPILLGKTLTTSNTEANQLLNVRYNWKSKQIPQRQYITENSASTNSYKLVVREDTSEPYRYDGAIDPTTADPESAHLALIFDKEKSAFILESISNCLNFNLTSATTKPNIEQLPQLETKKTSTANSSQNGRRRDHGDGEEDAADAENPYDYRHFLAEARKDAEAGNATPKPFTMASPNPGASRVLTNKSATSLQSPFTGPSKRRRVEPKPEPRSVPKTSNPAASSGSKTKSRANGGTSKAKTPYKSAEKISFSDEEKEEPASGPKTKHGQDNQGYAPSPQIIVDEALDLTIDMGSPPPVAKRKHRINPDAFSSHSRPPSRAGTASVSPHPTDVRDSDHDAEEDIEMDDGEEDDDVEDLALPSPRETRKTSLGMNRITQESGIEDDDEDDGLAAELEAVFEQEDDRDNGTVGLGISAGQNEEESEVSEEE